MANHQKHAHISEKPAEQQLWIAVYHRLVDDAVAFVRNQYPPLEGSYNDLVGAHHSIMQMDEDFHIVCHRAGLDPEAEHARFKKLVDRLKKRA